MTFADTKRKVLNRGVPPDSFLEELIMWARGADDAVFAPNVNPADVYAHMRPILGPWTGLPNRRAAMLEMMRVHAGFESSWNWSEGVDRTNRTSMANITGQETGIFQVSFDSTYLGNGAMQAFADEQRISTPPEFIAKMKTDRWLALEYYARLVRVSIQWAGPLKRHEVDRWLSRDAVAEFEELVAM